MILFSHPLALLLCVPLVALTVVIWRNGYVNLSPRRARVALGIRLALIGAIVLGLAGLSLRLPQSRESVVFVADLSASDRGDQDAMRALINSAAAQRPGDAQAGVIDVGREPLVEQPVSGLHGFDGFQSQVDRDYTNLEGGLELAGAMLPDGYRHRVVVLTDGRQNVGDALGAVRLLRSRGVRVDVVPARIPGGPEVLVDRIDAPSQLRPHETFSLGITVQASVPTTSRIDVFRDSTLVLSQRVSLRTGSNHFQVRQPPLHPGFHSYQVHIYPATDTLGNNNTGSAVITVQGAPHVLVIAADAHEAANVMASLHTTGIQADLQKPSEVIPTLTYLQRYAGVVIVDTAADELGPALMDQLVPYVRDLGRGLVVVGGQDAYGMGGYGQTSLEQVLPVRMDLPKRKDLPSAAVVLIIESLEADLPVNISKQAGKGVIQLLTERDQIAVNDTPYDGSPGWVVPLQPATNKLAIDHAIDNMQPGDPQSYSTYLRAAYQSLLHAHARIKHIILLGDGDAEDSDYETLLKQIRKAGITVSTVATNGQGFADYQTMQNIARWGGGRYYRADDTNSIPRIFLREARTVARSGIIEGKFTPTELSANPMLRDITAVPPLYGYVATTPKPTGEMVLVSKKLDPVLAGWQFGLGRAVAWTSDAAGRWTSSWLQAPGANRFWANLVSWTLPSSQGNHLFISASTAEGQGRISVDTPSALGADPVVTARIVDPTLHATEIALLPNAPGQYKGAFPAKRQGSYFVTVEARGAGHGQVGQAGLDVPYSAEFRTSGADTTFLRALAQAGGGSIISSASAAWADNLTSVFDQSSLTWLLWLLALLLLPIDIGARRLVVSRRDLIAIRDALPFIGRPPVSAEPAVAALGSLRVRRETQRSRARPAAQPQLGAPRVAAPAAGSGSRPVPRPAVNPAPTAQTARAAEQPESTASKLLAAKRRRR
jgi:uncharacterized membrane protein